MAVEMLEVGMRSYKCALISACLVIVLHGESFADEVQTETVYPAHLNWSGDFSQVETRDGSVLNEYIAQSGSVNVDGARLVVSMMPRFSCEPMISTIVTGLDVTDRVSVIDLKLTVGDDSFDFPSIVDWEKALLRFSLNSERKHREELREALDRALRATFDWSINSVVGSSIGVESDRADSGSFDFSLMGSRRTLQDMQDLCFAHIPEPL